MKKTLKIAVGLILLLLVVLFFVNGYYDDQKLQEKAKADFAKKYPTYELIYSGVGEGNLVVVEVHIEFRKETSDSIYKEVWPYWKIDDGWINGDEQEQLIKATSK